jgi:hypothetical protein
MYPFFGTNDNRPVTRPAWILRLALAMLRFAPRSILGRGPKLPDGSGLCRASVWAFTASDRSLYLASLFTYSGVMGSLYSLEGAAMM